jgi:hypothetical protein
MDTSFDPDDDLSIPFGPETLAERDMDPPPPKSSSSTGFAVEVIMEGPES